MNFKSQYQVLMDEANGYLNGLLDEKKTPERTIYKAMKYSLEAGGKRLRPVLCLAVAEMLGLKKEHVLPFAAAIEMIHTYSLIHDDLPVMDNDDYRRGKLTNHKVFGEATAILAGDALLNKAFEIMLEDMASEKDPATLERKVRAASAIARSSGTDGMIGGQVVDLESEGREIPAGILKYMHEKKTGAIIRASVTVPAILSGVAADKYEALDVYAKYIGIGFQIKDDIMDVECSLDDMGKQGGSDKQKRKSTYVTHYGLEESKKLLKETIDKAALSLEPFGGRAAFLIELARFIAERTN